MYLWNTSGDDARTRRVLLIFEVRKKKNGGEGKKESSRIFDLHTMASKVIFNDVYDIFNEKKMNDEFFANSKFLSMHHLCSTWCSFFYAIAFFFFFFLRGNLYNILLVYFAISQGSRKLIYRIIVVFGILMRILCILRVFLIATYNSMEENRHIDDTYK